VTDQGIPDAVKAAWDRTVAAWEDPAAHAALLAVVANYSCYVWAAAQYKKRAGDKIADRALVRIRKAATAQMLATAMSRPKQTGRTPYRSSMFVLIVVVFMIGVAFMYAKWRQRHANDDDDAPTTTDAQH
jgi:protein-S-isoprenylcysteine O-methyltransferase Ste14